MNETRHTEWKRRQALQPSPGVLVEPTLPMRINRLNPRERHEVKRVINSMKLRKIIRRILVEAYWTKPQPDHSNLMLKLHETEKLRASFGSYERTLTAYEGAQSFVPVVLNSTGER